MSMKMGRPAIAEAERKTERLHLAITPKLRQAVEAQARSQDVPASQVIRAALMEYLRGKEDSINDSD